MNRREARIRGSLSSGDGYSQVHFCDCLRLIDEIELFVAVHNRERLEI
jgi:hypothetical protein